MDNFIKSLPTILRVAGDSLEVREASAIAAWKHAAGEGLRAHAVPIKLQGETLIVFVADAVWQKQLGAMLAQLLFRINEILGQPLVKFIELQVDPLMANRAGSSAPQNLGSVDNEVPLELWAAANAIADKELRQVFLSAAVMQTKRLEKQNK